MIEHVVVATDGSENANRAVQFASELAARFGADLAVVHVLLRDHLDEGLRRFGEVEHLTREKKPSIAAMLEDIPPAQFPHMLVPANAADSADEILTAVAEQVLQAAEDVALECGVEKVRKVTRDGSAARCILEAAREADADVIVMGTRGLSSIEELLQGSVSHKVTQLAPCAVTLVR
jgi:nucleotide-binding universal stress UspA family protein